MTARIKPPRAIPIESLDYNYFLLWMSAFNDYVDLTQTSPTSDLKIKLFLSVAGLDVRKLVGGLTPIDSKFDSLIGSLKSHLKPAMNTVLCRHKFANCVQQPPESVSDFIVRLKQLAINCNFGDDTIDTVDNQMIRDQLIRGLTEGSIREHLLTHSDLKLSKAESIALSFAQAQSDNENISKLTKKETVLAVSTEMTCYNCGKQGHKAMECRKMGSYVGSSSSEKSCYTCGKRGHVSSQCYKNAKCSFCLRIGHTEQACRAKQIDARGTYEKKSQMSFFSCVSNDGNLRYLRVTLFGQQSDFLVDTGASVSLISQAFIDRNDLKNNCEMCHLETTLANGTSFVLPKKIHADLSVNGATFLHSFYVADIHVPGILGMDLIPRVGLHIEQVCGISVAGIPPILAEYSDVFNKPLKDSVLVGIEPFQIIGPTTEFQPKPQPARRLPAEEDSFVTEKVKELLEAGVIEESTSAWRHSPVIVPKPDGSKRMVINYKPVNAQTSLDAYPLPLIDDLLAKLSGAKIFSNIDFSQFYHQLPLANCDSSKTAFHAGGKLYQYVRCPFRLKTRFRTARE